MASRSRTTKLSVPCSARVGCIKSTVLSAPDKYIHLDGTCKGTPFKTVDSMQQRCALCGAKTSWYCMGCKQWFCLEKKVKNDMSGVDTFGVGVKEARGKDTKFQVSCFHRKHLQYVDE